MVEWKLHVPARRRPSIGVTVCALRVTQQASYMSSCMQSVSHLRCVNLITPFCVVGLLMPRLDVDAMMGTEE
jgi:hypothetical protein